MKRLPKPGSDLFVVEDLALLACDLDVDTLILAVTSVFVVILVCPPCDQGNCVHFLLYKLIAHPVHKLSFYKRKVVLVGSIIQ